MLRLIVAFLAVLIFEPFIANICTSSAQIGCKPCYRPTEDENVRIENKSPDVTALNLDSVELTIPLPEGSPPTHVDYSREMLVNVETYAEDPEGDILIYSYTVSGGRIVGTGSKVTWDLNKVMPGTYTLTAGVDDGCGLCGKRGTRTIIVRENESAPRCVCPKITISDSYAKREKRPDERGFHVNLSGPDRLGITYNWTLSEGTILSGQGTRAITVDPSGDPRGRPVAVTVAVSGLDPNCECPSTATRNLRY